MSLASLWFAALALLVPPGQEGTILRPLEDHRVQTLQELVLLANRQPKERREQLIREFSVYAARLGQEQQAFDLAETLEVPQSRIIAYGGIASRLTDWNAVEGATLAIRYVLQDNRSPEAANAQWTMLVYRFAENGNFPAAREAAAHITGLTLQAETLLRAAQRDRTLPREELQQLARHLIGLWKEPAPGQQLNRHDLGWRAEVCMLAGDIEQGMKYLQQMATTPPNPFGCMDQDQACTKAVTVLAGQGKFEQAYRIISELTFNNPASRGQLIGTVCREQIRQGQVEQALAHLLLPDLSENHWCNLALADLVDYEIGRKRPDRAEDYAFEIVDPAQSVPARLKVAEAYHRAGQPVPALRVLARLELMVNNQLRDSTQDRFQPRINLAQIAQRYAKFGQQAAARRLLAQLLEQDSDPGSRFRTLANNPILEEIATVYLLLNDHAGLQQLLDELWQHGLEVAYQHVQQTKQMQFQVLEQFRALSAQYARLGRIEIPLARARDLQAGLWNTGPIYSSLAWEQGLHHPYEPRPDWIDTIPREEQRIEYLKMLLDASFHRFDHPEHFPQR